MEAMALGRSAHVAEPAGDQKTAAEGIEPGAALESRQRTRLAHRRDPAQGNSGEPRGPNVEAAVGEKPEVDAAHDAKLQSPAAMCRPPTHRRGGHTGELIRVGDHARL